VLTIKDISVKHMKYYPSSQWCRNIL